MDVLANDAKHTEYFLDSSRFIPGFQERNRFSSPRSHSKRRSAEDVLVIGRWTREMTEFFDSVPTDRISNADETSWRLDANAIVTWAPTGTDVVHHEIIGDEKDCFPVLATVSAAGQKSPILLIAKGKIRACKHEPLADCPPHVACHSESGWMKEDLFKAYLQWLSPQLNGESFHLLLDCYSAQWTMDVKALALQLEIILHCTPVGERD
jgi:hypothetical protein